MNFLEERILKDAVVKPGKVLKVDSFLNHQIDIGLLEQIGQAFYHRFAGVPVTKVLTIETSGIAVAYPVARAFGVPLVCAKKRRSIHLDGDMYVAEVETDTPKITNQVIVAKRFLEENDHVLIVDDFLANGYTLQGLISLVDAAEATVEGLGIAIEKGFLEGGYRLRNLGYRLEALAILEDLDDKTGQILFRQQPDGE